MQKAHIKPPKEHAIEKIRAVLERDTTQRFTCGRRDRSRGLEIGFVLEGEQPAEFGLDARCIRGARAMHAQGKPAWSCVGMIDNDLEGCVIDSAEQFDLHGHWAERIG